MEDAADSARAAGTRAAGAHSAAGECKRPSCSGCSNPFSTALASAQPSTLPELTQQQLKLLAAQDSGMTTEWEEAAAEKRKQLHELLPHGAMANPFKLFYEAERLKVKCLVCFDHVATYALRPDGKLRFLLSNFTAPEGHLFSEKHAERVREAVKAQQAGGSSVESPPRCEPTTSEPSSELRSGTSREPRPAALPPLSAEELELFAKLDDERASAVQCAAMVALRQRCQGDASEAPLPGGARFNPFRLVAEEQEGSRELVWKLECCCCTPVSRTKDDPTDFWRQHLLGPVHEQAVRRRVASELASLHDVALEATAAARAAAAGGFTTTDFEVLERLAQHRQKHPLRNGL